MIQLRNEESERFLRGFSGQECDLLLVLRLQRRSPLGNDSVAESGERALFVGVFRSRVRSLINFETSTAIATGE